MTEEDGRHSPVQRILVALDDSVSSRNALDTAVDLAACFDAKLVGLFVEDINLMRLTELPFAREVSSFSNRPRLLKPPEMALQLRIQAERIRRLLARTAEGHGVPWEFRTARGAVGVEVLSAGAEADLVILGKIGRSLPGIQRSGSTVKMLLMKRRGMTLIQQQRVRFLGMPTLAVYDGGEALSQTLETAAYLARSHNVSLIVLVVGKNPDEVHALQSRAVERLEKLDTIFKIIRMVNPDLLELAHRIRRESSGPVVIPCLEDWFEGEKLCRLVEEIENPVLLIR